MVSSLDAVTSRETVTDSPDRVSIRLCSAPPAARFCSRAAVPFLELAESVLIDAMLLRPSDGGGARLPLDNPVSADRRSAHGICAIVRHGE